MERWKKMKTKKNSYFNPSGYSKYGNRKVTVDGITFDSQTEADRWAWLRIMERGGVIKDLRRQVRYELVPKQTDENMKMIESSVSYIADFVYRDQEGKEIVEDAKGYKTDVYRIKKKLMLWVHGIRIQEV